MYVLYTNNSILAGPSRKEIQQAIKDIKATGLTITEEGDLQDGDGRRVRLPDQEGSRVLEVHACDGHGLRRVVDGAPGGAQAGLPDLWLYPFQVGECPTTAAVSPPPLPPCIGVTVVRDGHVSGVLGVSTATVHARID